MHFLASWKRALGIDLISYRSYSFVSLFRGFAFLTRVYVEYSLQNRFVFFYFPLWPVRHFENSSRRACALRGVSGCVHLESRKTNVRRTRKRVWYVEQWKPFPHPSPPEVSYQFLHSSPPILRIISGLLAYFRSGFTVYLSMKEVVRCKY